MGDRWNTSIIENIDQRDLRNYYRNLTKTRVGAELQYFQFQIITRTLLVTNRFSIKTNVLSVKTIYRTPIS